MIKEGINKQKMTFREGSCLKKGDSRSECSHTAPEEAPGNCEVPALC